MAEIPQKGDRGAFDTISYASKHAKDIEDETLKRHLAAPGTTGNIMRDDGTNWVAVAEADYYLKINQTTPQNVTGGQPDFNAGLRAGSTDQLAIDASGNVVTSGYISCDQFTDSGHYTGFPDQVSTSLSWDDGTYTLTLTATSDPIWINGVAYTINTLTKQLSVAQEAVSGLYWFWITAPGGTPELNASVTAPGFDKCLVATVYWNTTTSKGIISNERHWFGRDQWMHEYLHETVGARYASGLGGTFGDTTFTIGVGEFYDEDIEHNIAEQTTCKVLYHNGDADWAWDAAATTPYKVVGGGDTNLRYNNGNALATVSNNKYMNQWVFITADITHPVNIVIGTAEYNTIALARAASVPSLGSLVSAEAKLIYKITYQNDGGSPLYIESTDYRSSSNLPSTSYVATDHGSLSGLSDNDHPQYMLNTVADANSMLYAVTDDTPAALALAANKFAARSSSGNIEAKDITDFALTVLDDANAAAVLATIGGVGTHALLSASHTDILADTVVRGDLIVGNSTPKWARLAKGDQYKVLTMGADDPAWSGFLITGTSGGKVNLAVTNTKTLTLTAAGDYNITFPNSMSFPADADGYLKNTSGVLSWAAAAGGGDVATDTIWDAKGDLAVGTGANTASKLTVGTNGQMLYADSTQATGVRWDDAPTGTGDITGIGVVGQVAEFVTNTKTLQAAKIIGPASNILTITNAAASTLAMNVSSGKTLTFTATDNYTLTIPATGTAALLGTANVFTAAQQVESTIYSSYPEDFTYEYLSGTSTTAKTMLVAYNTTAISSDPAASTTVYGALYMPRVAATSASYFIIAGGAFYAPVIESSDAGARLAVQGLNVNAYRNRAGDTSAYSSNQIQGISIGHGHFTAVPSSAVTGTDYGYLSTLVNRGGTITTAYGYRATASVGHASGAANPVVGTYYGLFLGAATFANGGSITNNYGVYQEDTTATNYFAGPTIFNEGGNASSDIRWESDTEENMLYGDANGSTDGELYFGGTTNGMRVKKGGIVDIIGTGTFSCNNNITTSTGNIVIGTSGKGIDFSADSAAAGMTSELLDDYEEGTWTPGVSFGGGTTGLTYDSQNGFYTKIGNTVTAQFRIYLSNKGSSAGAALVTGLPFTSNSGANYRSAASLYFGTTSFANQYTSLLANSATTIALYEATEAGAVTTIDNTNFANTSLIAGTIVYII